MSRPIELSRAIIVTSVVMTVLIIAQAIRGSCEAFSNAGFLEYVTDGCESGEGFSATIVTTTEDCGSHCEILVESASFSTTGGECEAKLVKYCGPAAIESDCMAVPKPLECDGSLGSLISSETNCGTSWSKTFSSGASVSCTCPLTGVKYLTVAIQTCGDCGDCGEADLVLAHRWWCDDCD